MEYTAVVETLKQQALRFHRALVQAHIYPKEISEHEFLQRVEDEVSKRARNVVQGIEDLDLVKVDLPISLLYCLKDIVPVASWDYEFGYEALFQEFERLFVNTRHRFAWSYDEASSILRYALDNQIWVLEGLSPLEEVDWEVYERIRHNMTQHLLRYGETLYDEIGTGDQTIMVVLAPREAVSVLAEYLPKPDIF